MSLSSKIHSALVIGILGVVATVVAAPTSNYEIIHTPVGAFQGPVNGSITRFLGIPFAQPPTGNLRLRPPQALQTSNSSRIYNASQFGPACRQQNSPFPDVLPFKLPSEPSPPRESEDCLYLNIWKPKELPTSPVPVLLFIVGGAFENGSEDINDGTSLVTRSLKLGQPIVFVTIAYRLNALGFLGGKEIEKAGLGNLGFLDQRLALRWVQQNIGYFGGDKNKVTIWGESSGGMSVGLHMVFDGGRTSGLFRAAVLESGFPWVLPNIKSAQPTFDLIAKATNCSSSSDVISCIRKAPVESITSAVNTVPGTFNYTALALKFQPFVDGKIFLENPERSVRKGAFAKVPIITGDCGDEGTFFSLGNTNITTDAQFKEYLRSVYLTYASAPEIDAVAKAYPSTPSEGSPFDTGNNYTLTPQYKRIAAFTGDYIFEAPRRLLQIAAVKAKINVWAFLYNRGAGSPYLGAAHSTDIYEFFGHGNTTDFIGADSLVNFATTLNPNAPKSQTANSSLVQQLFWPQWTRSGKQMLEFVDPAPSVRIIKDNYREVAINVLTNISLRSP